MSGLADLVPVSSRTSTCVHAHLSMLTFKYNHTIHQVALTDSVQGVIMIFGAVSVTCVIKYYWGGWVALDPSTFPSPEFYQTPTKNQQWIWFQLTLLTVSQAFYPVTIQRIYAASSLEGVRMGALTMFAGRKYA